MPALLFVLKHLGNTISRAALKHNPGKRIPPEPITGRQPSGKIRRQTDTLFVYFHRGEDREFSPVLSVAPTGRLFAVA